MRLKKFVRSIPGQFAIASVAVVLICLAVAKLAPWIMLHVFLHGGL